MQVVLNTPAEGDDNIVNDNFFPDISLATIREQQRIDSSVPSDRLRAIVIEAIMFVNQSLQTLKASALAFEQTTFVTEADTQIDGISINQHRYLRAVGCMAKANVIERYRDMDTSQQGQKNADDISPNIDELRRDAYWAIADLTGRPRTVVELI